jgi:hypothetical protein
MTDFNFLRIKWPKLAAIAADASRLVEVSPSSAISTMQNFCEWAADIALDLNDIAAQNGITQQEKLETLKATGHAPADIIGRFQNVMLAGGRRLYRQNEDVEEARICIEDVYEIGRWLNKEADRAGWPPKNDYYKPMMNPLGMPSEGGGFSAGGIGEKLMNYRPLIIVAVGIVVVLAAAIFGITYVIGLSKKANTAPTIYITPTPSATSTPTLITAPSDDISPTPEPEVFKYVDALRIANTSQNTVYKGKWKFKSGDRAFTIGDKTYTNGIGFYIDSSRISKKQGTMTVKFTLDDTYDRLMFDLGVDPMQYGAKFGLYRVQIFCDSTDNQSVYDCGGLKDYEFTDMGVTVDLTPGCKTLVVFLTEQKGASGTLNIVLGNMRVVKGGSGEITESASPSPTPTGSADASGGGSMATATAGEGGEQQPPP